MSLRDLLNRAAQAIDAFPDPSVAELRLVRELREYSCRRESEWQRRALSAEAELKKLKGM